MAFESLTTLKEGEFKMPIDCCIKLNSILCVYLGRGKKSIALDDMYLNSKQLSLMHYFLTYWAIL